MQVMYKHLIKIVRWTLLLVLALHFWSCDAQSQQNSVHLTNGAFQKKMKEANVVILDIRTPEEFQSGHLSNAINIDFYQNDFVQKISQLDTAKTYLLYCRSGNRTGQAVKLFQQKGIPHVFHLKWGIISWDGPLQK